MRYNKIHIDIATHKSLKSIAAINGVTMVKQLRMWVANEQPK